MVVCGEEDSGTVSVGVAVAVAAAFEDFDLVGDAFGVGVGLGVFEVVEDEGGPGAEVADEVVEFG